MADENDKQLAIVPTVETIERRFSDLSITCENRIFKVHRWNLYQISDVFKREIDNPAFEEANGIIKHDEYDADTVERMIDFIYDGDYTVPNVQLENMEKVEGTGDSPNLLIFGEEDRTAGVKVADEEEWTANDILMAHVRVHGIASYYQIPDLAKLAATNFETALEVSSWPQPGFVDVLQAIYLQPESEDQGIRAVVTKASIHKAEKLLQDTAFTKALCDGTNFGEFAAQLLRALAQELQLKRTELLNTETFYTEAVHDLADVQALTERLSRCRHCHVDMDVVLEKENGRFLVRCGKCRTRHT